MALLLALAAGAAVAYRLYFIPTQRDIGEQLAYLLRDLKDAKMALHKFQIKFRKHRRLFSDALKRKEQHWKAVLELKCKEHLAALDTQDKDFLVALDLKDEERLVALELQRKECLAANYKAFQRGLQRGKEINDKLKTENNILEARCKTLQGKIDQARLMLRP